MLSANDKEKAGLSGVCLVAVESAADVRQKEKRNGR
jgi:hypothetical protein